MQKDVSLHIDILHLLYLKITENKNMKDITYYRKSISDKWYRVHYENIKVGDIIRTFSNDKKWEYMKVDGINADGILFGQLVHPK